RGGDAFAASVPAAVGEAVVVCGTQETYVSDYDVDVASRVSIANPQVDAGTSAYVFHVRAGRGTDRVRATLSTHFRDGGRRPYDADSEEISTLHQPRFLVAKASAAL